MSSSRYPDSRYGRDRSPYRDRRSSTYSSGYPPRASDSTSRSNTDSSNFPPRETPRGPKSLVDAPRGTTVAPSGAPSAPRDGRGRGFAGRSEAPSLRDAPPLSSVSHSHNSWRSDRDRDRDFDRDRRDRRPSPRRSPVRDSRDSREQRDFPPRDLDINRARRNSRDGPPSAGSTYSDPPLGAGSSYRGSGIGRGGRGDRGGRDFHGDVRGRGRNFHNDDRDRHHDARDRIPDRSYRPRSRSRDPVRRERDPRDDRDFDRRDRDERRYVQREYDSYIGPAGSLKSGPRALDTHRGSAALDTRHVPGTPTGATPHSTHHSPADRLGPSVDSYSRRSSTATEPLAKEGRREPGRDDLLLASRAEASRERYAPRASSPPAAVPAFGFSSNVWRNPALDAKPTVAPQPSKPAPSAALAPVVSSSTPAALSVPTAPKTSIPSGLSTAPPTGPKADRLPERSHGDTQIQSQNPDSRVLPIDQSRNESRPPVTPATPLNVSTGHEIAESKATVSTPSFASAPVESLFQGSAARPRAPPTGPQAALRANVSPSFPRPAHLPYVQRDVPRDSSPSAIPPPIGSRNGSGSGSSLSANTSPKALPANIPTGPKADRANAMGPRASSMYPPPDRPGFQAQRMSMGGPPKSMQWVRPGLNLSNRTTVPTKREFPAEDRDRSFGTAPKAPKLDANASTTDLQRLEKAKSESPSLSRPTSEAGPKHVRNASGDSRRDASPKPSPIKTRRLSDISMAEASPHPEKPPQSATSSAPEVLEDSDDDLDLDEADFAESEAKYNKEKAILESKRINLSASHLRATTPLQEIMLLASLTVDHLPRQETKSVDEETAPIAALQPPPESTTTELPTPKAEEVEDMVLDEKEEKPLAPATQALRLRRGTDDDQDDTPDFTSLPYLGSGPPTPISDLEGPRVSESVMLAIRDKLRKNIEPELDPEDALEQYIASYRRWRFHIRNFDDAREPKDPERQPSAEPTTKVTTPDVQSSAMAPILDLPLTTGRRGHSRRWPTELDIEAVIKESLKTAEEERMGKKEKEPKRSLADPEKEATVPLELTAYEAQRRRFIDTNFQQEPGHGIFVFHYEPPEDDFTEEEHKIMVQHYRDQYAKKWGKLAEQLYKEAGTSRTYKDCINHYYATKWGREYKGKVKGRRGGPRRRGAGRGRGAIANMERPEPSGDDGLSPALTETGRPRRSAAPTFGAETDLDTTTSTPTPGRLRRQTDADKTVEKPARRGKAVKEKGGRKIAGQPLAAAPLDSPVKLDRKALRVKMEDEVAKRPLGEMPLPMQPSIPDDQLTLSNDPQFHPGLSVGMNERPKAQSNARPGPSSYWSVTEQTDFQRYVAHFGTDWAAIANHMGTKTQVMVKNQYLRLVESGQAPDLQRVAEEANKRKDRGEDLGPPPPPTPAPKRRYEPTQVTIPRTLAPTPEATSTLPIALPKASPPSSVPSSRFSNIAQAPQGKPLVAGASYTMSESPLTSIPSIPLQQSPPGHTPRGQSQHNIQQPAPQPEARRPGPHRGYFSQDMPARQDHRPPSQSSSMPPASRSLQPQVKSALRTHEQPQPSIFRTSALPDREPLPRAESQPEHDAHLRFQRQHSRTVSSEVAHARPFPPGGPSMSQTRTGPGAASPENRPLLLQHRHGEHPPISSSSAPPAPEHPAHPQNSIPSVQQLPPRSSITTPPVKEEPRHYPLPPHPQPQTQPQVFSPSVQPPTQTVAPPPAPKPAPEPRKSNLMSLLNDAEPEEPKRKKPVESNVPSHTPTPQQQTPIAPPPPAPQTLGARRDPYSEPSTQSAYSRPTYAQQAAVPQGSSARQIVDLTREAQAGRPVPREDWQRQPFQGQNSGAQGPSLNSPRTSIAQPAFSDARIFGNHRAVFAQHNAPRANPSPPPLSAYGNSPHVHSRTPSLSGPPNQHPRHGLNASAAAQGGTSQILQPNPYAQVEPGSSSQPTGPVGMRPSPHLHTNHLVPQRDLHGRNEQSQVHNGGLAYSNPQTASEHHPTSQHMRGPSIADQYRARDPRDVPSEFDPRNPDRDMSRELSLRADVLLRERDPLLSRSVGPPTAHQDIRYQPPPHDRGFTTQRSHTPLSRSDHGPPPPLQHPPHSSLGDSHALYGQRQEDPSQRFRDSFPRDQRITDRIREEQAQQHAAMSRDEYIREREMQYRDSLLRRDIRGAPSAPGQDQRGPSGAPMDWASAVRPPPDNGWRR